MQKQIINLDSETFKKIYTDKNFRNTVAYAHGYTSNTGENGLITCSHPIQYIVTEDQKKEAAKEIDRDKQQILNDLGNKLVFVGMGATYDPKFEDDICNHRVRTEFRNQEGKYFIEASLGRTDEMIITHSVDRKLEEEYEAQLTDLNRRAQTFGGWHNAPKTLIELKEKYMKQDYYNFGGLEMSKGPRLKYTRTNLLNLVNRIFDCKFTEIEIDNHTLGTDDFICVSPSK